MLLLHNNEMETDAVFMSLRESLYIQALKSAADQKQQS